MLPKKRAVMVPAILAAMRDKDDMTCREIAEIVCPTTPWDVHPFLRYMIQDGHVDSSKSRKCNVTARFVKTWKLRKT